MRKFFVATMLIILSIITPSCDEQAGKNSIEIGGTVHYITEAYYIDYENHVDDYYEIGLLLYGMTTMTNNILLSFSMKSTTDGDFTDGEYKYSRRDKKMSFNNASWNILLGTPIEITEGSVSVEHVSGEYKFTVNCVDQDGNSVVGEFVGALFKQEL